MTLEELSTAWNNLRNAALGRGTTPNVSPALAREVGAEYDAWRAAYGDFSPTADFLSTFYSRTWVQRYRRLLARVEKAGIALPASQKLEPDILEQALASVDRFSKNLALSLGVVGAGVVLYYVARKGDRGR